MFLLNHKSDHICRLTLPFRDYQRRMFLCSSASIPFSLEVSFSQQFSNELLVAYFFGISFIFDISCIFNFLFSNSSLPIILNILTPSSLRTWSSIVHLFTKTIENDKNLNVLKPLSTNVLNNRYQSNVQSLPVY